MIANLHIDTFFNVAKLNLNFQTKERKAGIILLEALQTWKRVEFSLSKQSSTLTKK